jgi:hypothetical protein
VVVYFCDRVAFSTICLIHFTSTACSFSKKAKCDYKTPFSTAPNARSVAFCASERPRMPVIVSRS